VTDVGVRSPSEQTGHVGRALHSPAYPLSKWVSTNGSPLGPVKVGVHKSVLSKWVSTNRSLHQRASGTRRPVLMWPCLCQWVSTSEGLRGSQTDVARSASVEGDPCWWVSLNGCFNGFWLRCPSYGCGGCPSALPSALKLMLVQRGSPKGRRRLPSRATGPAPSPTERCREPGQLLLITSG
jgi:hypothetical protein